MKKNYAKPSINVVTIINRAPFAVSLTQTEASSTAVSLSRGDRGESSWDDDEE